MEKKKKNILLWLLDLAVNLAIIILLVIVIQKWIIAPFDISGASMCDTLNNIDGECVNSYGEKIIVNEAGYLFGEPQRGDIIVFRPNEEEPKYYIKRIIGLPGETVEIRDGSVYITNPEEEEILKLNENYLNANNYENTKTYFSDFSVFEVPENKYFVMGDNRKASTDSRSCFLGSLSESCKDNPEDAFVSRDLIRGKAWIVWWPIPNIRMIDTINYVQSENQAIPDSLEEK